MRQLVQDDVGIVLVAVTSMSPSRLAAHQVDEMSSRAVRILSDILAPMRVIVSDIAHGERRENLARPFAHRAKARIDGIEDVERSADSFRIHIREDELDRKSTRLNSSHVRISYAVFC